MLLLSGIGQCFSQTRPTVLYVDASYTGTTTSDGSEEFPFTTIRAALDYRGNVIGLTGMVSDEKIIVKAGTYIPTDSERIFITSTNGGKEGFWFTLEAEGNVYIDGTNLYTTKFASLIAITSAALNVKVKGFKLKSLRNNQSLASTVNGVFVKDGKFGIQVANTVKNVEITDNEIYDFSWTLNVDPMKNRLDFTSSEIDTLKTAQGGDNCGAINVTGTDTIPITNLVIKNNYIHNIIPGWTEGIQVNGNVDGFEITNNIINEVQNIGIVAAGHYNWVTEIEGATVTAALNYARNGIIKNNKVSSCRSPIAAAAGIYCDGSQNIIVENNTSSDGQVGFSIGNENSNVNSGGHKLRNNLSYDNSWAGIILGVPGAASGSYIDNVIVTGNTVFRNGGVTDTYLGYMGASECVINKNIQNLIVKNNIFYAANHNTLVSFAMPFDTAMASYVNTISYDYNLYYTNSTETTPLGVFDWSQLGTGYDYYGTFDWYRVNRTNQDVNSSFTNPNFVNIASSPLDLSLQVTSSAINAGDPNYVVASGETDFYGNNRIDQSIVDIGAYEAGAVAAGDEAASIDGVNSAGEDYIALQTGVTQGVWKNIYAYDDNNFIYVYAEYDGSLPEYSIFVNTDSQTGFQETWTDKTNYYVDGTLNLLNRYKADSNNQEWPYMADNNVMNIRFVQTASTIEGRIPKDALGLGNAGTIGLGITGYTANWPTSVGSIPLESNAMVYLTLDGGSDAGSLSVDGYKSPVEDYQALITGVTGSSFNNIYGYTDSEYIYLYADIEATNLSEYEVYINTDTATGFQYLWSDKTNYFIDANYNVLNSYNNDSSGWPFSEASNSTGIEFIMTPLSIEGKILKSLLGLGNSGTIGIGLEGHTANWNSSLGGIPVSGNMVYLSLGGGSSAKSTESKSTLEIEMLDESSEFKLKTYPNPALDKLTIDYLLKDNAPVSIQLIGLDGRIYYSKEIHQKAGKQTQSILVQNFNRGIYILKIKTLGGVETKKIIFK
ncbi:T9SS type A sorting domain-containing protein [Gaetbulibacter sp. M235]|uniref:T9SS type A sorting domain-containing protein n=1 Tax=Gaetbulibacter sp. M235 TaxID=3126510 RepID=UPI00374FAFFE